MDMNTCIRVANTINEQIFGSIDKWTYFSWGVSKKIACYYEGKPSLKLRVSGLLHKGWVIISLDEGRDLYEVRLLNLKDNVKKVVNEVYCDELGYTIDTLVERPEAMNDEDYYKKAMADSKRKMNK